MNSLPSMTRAHELRMGCMASAVVLAIVLIICATIAYTASLEADTKADTNRERPAKIWEKERAK